MKKNAKALGYAHAMRRRIKADLPKEASMVSFAQGVVIVDGNAMLKQTEHSRAVRKAIAMGVLTADPFAGTMAQTVIGGVAAEVGGARVTTKAKTTAPKARAHRPSAP